LGKEIDEAFISKDFGEYSHGCEAIFDSGMGLPLGKWPLTARNIVSKTFVITDIVYGNDMMVLLNFHTSETYREFGVDLGSADQMIDITEGPPKILIIKETMKVP
jgi:hypothetical protein